MENLVTFSGDSNGKAVKTDKHRAFHLRKYFIYKVLGCGMIRVLRI